MSANTLTLARQSLLEPAGLGDAELARLMGQLMSGRLDYGDLYFQYSRHEAWSLEEGKVKSGTHSIEQGVGVRAVAGEKTGFAYSDDIVLPALLQAAGAARAIVQQGAASNLPAAFRGETGRKLYLPNDPLASLSDDAKVKLLERVEKEARAQDPRVKQVMASLASTHEAILVVRSDGVISGDVRPLVRLSVTVIVESNGRRESGNAGGGGRFVYDYFNQEDRALGYAREAVRQALVNLEAVDAPAGTMAVVLGPGWPGILLHEAIGHGLEGDFNRKGTSAFAGRIGQRVASEQCTVVDDGTIPDRRGSLNVDDEGTTTQRTVLIENGVLKGYMQDTMNARLMKVAPTGNGRRESYAHLPMPRMTNTYMLNGKYDPKEIIGSVEKGLYAVNFGGGQVDITSGKFVFSASEAYLIENGKLTRPVKGATLIGNGPDVLTRVSMVGNDMQLDPGVGTCGKEGQSVPVGVGQPTLKIDGLTVGGTQS
ncbi:MAG: metalloprotease TldD [Gammaproteobacteria bacterium]|nr:metalloprotease TldD [Gammaproteobacteria bacterium]MDH3370104.1 metalloprotease TldD [Gammaproteobacteria bacterium]MDH3406656.1 metalloprotease TldD [Gammaproteobacteria bacterium]MDH3562378.1 metalloprotease TldD [Gammaproteobacteria bacterium]MDH5487018.1 metalloprotease TldD [Gammaproteobacteria bacterium]